MTCFVVQGHIFCNILNVLTVTFDQFIASLLIDLKHLNSCDDAEISTKLAWVNS